MKRKRSNMRSNLPLVLALTLGLLLFRYAVADSTNVNQTLRVGVDEVSMLRGNPTPTVSFRVSPPTGGGGPPLVDGQPLTNSNSTTWVQYTSIIPPGSGRRKLQVSLTQAVPGGLAFGVAGAAPAGGGAGAKGYVGAGDPDLNLGEIADLTTGIGSCYTGTTPATDGVNVTWTCTLDDIIRFRWQPAFTVHASYTLTAAE